MNDITFTGIAAWFVGILFILLFLFIAGLIALEMAWRILATRSKKKLLKRWDEKYGAKQ